MSQLVGQAMPDNPAKMPGKAALLLHAFNQNLNNFDHARTVGRVEGRATHRTDAVCVSLDETIT
jgi:hypothetical protein